MPQRLRLLLVSTDKAWQDAAAAAAERLGAAIDVLPGVAEALSWMLNPDRVCTHVLASGPLDPSRIDALAGMVDEVTSRPTPLLLLGGDSTLGPSVVPVPVPDSEAIVQVVRDQLALKPPEAPSLSVPELRAALHAGWLRMRFQPILNAATLRPVGLEALARLHHPVLGILHPRDFLSQAVESGQERAFAGITAARSLLELRALATPEAVELLQHLRFALNVPLTTFCQPYAVDRARHLCEVAAVPPAQIVIEVLETPVAPDLVALAASVKAWRAAGFGVAIDDAGPALPHWRDLLDLDFSTVKLDGRVGGDPLQEKLAAEIAQAAKARGLFVIAEGIEDDAALTRMRNIGVDAVQGFLFSRPLPAMAVPIWLAEWRAQAKAA